MRHEVVGTFCRFFQLFQCRLDLVIVPFCLDLCQGLFLKDLDLFLYLEQAGRGGLLNREFIDTDDYQVIGFNGTLVSKGRILDLFLLKTLGNGFHCSAKTIDLVDIV